MNLKDLSEHAIACPLCGNNYTRPIKTAIFAGNDDYDGGVVLIVKEGLETLKGEMPRTPNRNRGMSLAIDFSCEDGHDFSVQYLFHKGMTYREVSNDPAIGDFIPHPEYKPIAITPGFMAELSKL